MNVEAFLNELRREHELIEETILVLERLLYAQNSRRSVPKGRESDLTAKPSKRKKAKARRQAATEPTGNE